MKSLYMSNPLIISKSPDKSNIKLIVCKVNLNEDLSTTFAWLLNDLKAHKNRTTKTIIYCCSICVCGELYSIFDHEMKSSTAVNGNELFAMFHSKTPRTIQDNILQSFVEPDTNIRVVIATSALGMGINIPDVGRICHFGVPSELEQYVQEIGRAGRDGRKSLALMYFKPYHLAHCEATMRDFVKNEDSNCRREMIAKYFKGKVQRVEFLHECCDACANKCKCNQPSCATAMYIPCGELNVDSHLLCRQVTNSDRHLLREVLVDLQHSTVCHTSIFGSGLLLDTIHDELINELVEKSESIFTVNYLMDNFAIFNIRIAKEIIHVFNEIFDDIDQAELISASVDNISQDDDPLYLNVQYDQYSDDFDSLDFSLDLTS